MIVNNQHTITVTQSAVRLVICEECNTEYVYQLERSGEGMGNSVYFLDEAGAKRRAERKAREQLARKMEHACEAIPCPRCGHYQDHMLAKARGEAAFKWGLLAALAMVLCVGGFVLALSTRAVMLGVGIGVLGLLAAIVLGIIGLVVNGSYDPNKKPKEERLRIAVERAFRRRDFEAGFAEAAGDEFEKFCKKLGKKKGRRFEIPVWADRGQIRHADPLPVTLPPGDKVTIKLRSDSRDGDEFAFPAEVDGYEVEIVCVLNVYTKTRARD
jgi:hypothetical protein